MSPNAGPRRDLGTVTANARVSAGLWRLDAALEVPMAFRPGQFAMLNLTGRDALVFSRPFSILSAVGGVSVLYRIVGRGTAAMAELRPGDAVSVLGPLGRPFPPREGTGPCLLLAGGVGLPPVAAWVRGQGMPDDIAVFGARDGHDVPWSLLPAPWSVAVDAPTGLAPGAAAEVGLVTEVAVRRLDRLGVTPGMVLACGPLPMLRAVAALAQERAWPCWLSLEEHMGCGYGVCKGCVVPVHAGGGDSWRNATCCQDGPVFEAGEICWERHHTASLGSSGS